MSESLEGLRGLKIAVGPGDSRGPEDLRGLRCLTSAVDSGGATAPPKFADSKKG